MGLGKVSSGDTTFLSIAGGFIWDRKADKNHECYAEQEYEKADKTTGVRTGAQYGDLTGKVVGVAFRTHAEYGESINVTFLASGEKYTVSISTNNRYSQDMMKALLVMDLEKSIVVKPYDFIGADKRRAQGISFKQDGEKLSLKVEVPDEFQKDEAWFKNAEKKQIKRFFEDLNEWYVSEVEEKVVPYIKSDAVEDESEGEEKVSPKAQEKEDKIAKEVAQEAKELAEEPKEEASKPSTLVMKRVLRGYISENYEGKTLPDLSSEDLFKWYELCLQEEELPFPSDETGEVDSDDLDSQLNALLEK
jgi:hypothetical protein